MKKIIAISLFLLSLTSCMTVIDEETSGDRVYNMQNYTSESVNAQVLTPLTVLALAVRVDDYFSLPETERSSYEWSDLSGKVFSNLDGTIVVRDLLEFDTGNTSIRVPGAVWRVGDYFTIECQGDSLWACVNSSADIAGILTVEADGDSKWTLDYSGTETYEDKSAVFTTKDLTATCDGKIVSSSSGYVDWATLSLPEAKLTGKVHVDFYSTTTLLDTLDATWKAGSVTYQTSRD